MSTPNALGGNELHKNQSVKNQNTKLPSPLAGFATLQQSYVTSEIPQTKPGFLSRTLWDQ